MIPLKYSHSDNINNLDYESRIDKFAEYKKLSKTQNANQLIQVKW